MIITENGIKYRVNKSTVLALVLSTAVGTALISNLLGVNDLSNLSQEDMLKVIPSSVLSLAISTQIIPKFIRFANPIKRRRSRIRGRKSKGKSKGKRSRRRLKN